jgi:osmotically-inducible protein OsmY
MAPDPHALYVDRSDREIQEALGDAILFDPRVNSFVIGSSVSSGVATLSGEVSTLAAKNAAGEIAENTVGVTRVANEVEVEPGTVMDPALELRTTSALKNNVITAPHEIQIDVDQGVAKLSGMVKTFAEKAQAEIVASNVHGIRQVENKLFVQTPKLFVTELSSVLDYPYVAPWASRVSSVPLKTDLEIQSDIERELLWSPYVFDDEVEVKVENGVATLTGSVESRRERGAAVANAYQGGAVSVDDQLELL